MDVNIDHICHTVIWNYFPDTDSWFRTQLHGMSTNGKELLIAKALFLPEKNYPESQVSVKSNWNLWYKLQQADHF